MSVEFGQTDHNSDSGLDDSSEISQADYMAGKNKQDKQMLLF